MMAHKQFLHELLKEDQEPFHLKTYISDKRSQLKNSSPATSLQLRKRNAVAPKNCTTRKNPGRNACFFSFPNSPDVTRSPFVEFQSPAISPCKSPVGAVFLHVPSGTASVLVGAAMRIQKEQQSKTKTQIKNVGFSLFGSLLKILKHRSKNKVLINYEPKGKENLQTDFGISCPCSCDKPEEFDEINGEFASPEPRFCASPFRFSLHKSPSSSGRRTQDCCSTAISPIRHVKQEEKNFAARENSDSAHVVEEEKERSSPVSVLDTFFADDAHESIDAEEDDYDLERSYANIERTRQQLLNRLTRFEKLAALDPVELEQKLLEGSDDEYQRESVESEDDDPLPMSRKQGVDTSANEVFSPSELQHNTKRTSIDVKRLVSDLIVDEKSKIIYSGNKEIALGRICNRLDLWREIEFSILDTKVELDFKREFEGWKDFPEQVEEMAAEVELAIFGVLVEELSDELLYMDQKYQELDCVPTQCR